MLDKYGVGQDPYCYPGSSVLRNRLDLLDEARLHQFHGTLSLPFEAGDHRKVAVKIVDDRGIESLKVLSLPIVS